jgi:hypothetical protein
MIRPIKHYDESNISAELIRQYQRMPMEKRLEWLYLGNLLHKAFCEMMDKEPFSSSKFNVKTVSR